MLRFPRIIEVNDSIPSRHFIVVMETETEFRGGMKGPGQIFRVDVYLPYEHLNDPEYVATEFANAFDRMARWAKKTDAHTPGVPNLARDYTGRILDPIEEGFGQNLYGEKGLPD